MKPSPLALCLILPLAALARDDATPGVDRRQARQEQRIEQGVKSGALTEREAARLERGQRRVEGLETRAKADGEVTPEERARLRQAQNQQSRRIAKNKHDRQTDRNHDGVPDRRRPHRPD